MPIRLENCEDLTEVADTWELAPCIPIDHYSSFGGTLVIIYQIIRCHILENSDLH
jgi:hypothetical protein